MKRIRIITAILLAAALLVSGCRREGAVDKPDDATPGGTDAVSVNPGPGSDAAEVLTHVYIPQAYSMPEGFELNSGVTPYYEAETDTLVCVGQRISEDGAEYRLVTTRGDAGVADEKPVPIPVDGKYVYMEHGFITADALWFITRQFDSEKRETSYRIAHTPLNAASGESGSGEAFSDGLDAGLTTELSPDLNSLLDSAEQFENIEGFAMDADGDFYVYDGAGLHAVAVFRPDFSLRCKVRASGGGTALNGIFTRPDGSVWCFGQIEAKRSAARVDKESLTIADPVRLPTSASASNQQLVRYAADDTLLFETSEGLFRSVGAGEEETEKLMDFLNSNLLVDKSVFLCAASRDALFYSGEDGCPVLWRSAGDVDLTTIRVLDVAITANLSAALNAKIVSFNRDHPDVRIVVKDYLNLARQGGQLWEDPAQNLAMDISLGRYRPDMILGKTGGADMNYCLREKLYVDLTPYLDRDPAVNRDNVFGAVLRAFDDGEGGLWGLADNFTISTVVAPNSILPAEYRDGWDLDGLLDFASSLPADVTLIEGLTRETAADRLLGTNGYAAFIDWDSMTCSYDSPTFLRWLSFVKSLPKDKAELSRVSELERLDGEEKYETYYSGKLALSRMQLYSVNALLDCVFKFDTYDLSFPGYPAAGGTLSTDFAFLVTTFSDAADEAWEFMTSVITEGDTMDSMMWRSHGRRLSVLKTSFDAMAENYRENYEFTYTFRGSGGMQIKDPEFASLNPKEPGSTYELTRDDTDRIRDYFDNVAGTPIKTNLPDEISAILSEELSALIADAATPESCAKNIQSRVSIWLAEHQ
ncbi:MAG: hypothetical protein IKQ92_06215 [Clostridia bacterium]|nr:hypothetical protein [Clostridia bacterium]